MNPVVTEENKVRPIEEVIPAQVLEKIDENILKEQAEYENRIQAAMSSLKDFVITH